jgi:2-oxoglutarate ferredoxin oxidoreductase subunit alpha
MPDLEVVKYLDKKHSAKRIKKPDAGNIDLVKRLEPDEAELRAYRRYKITENGISPLSVPGTAGGQYVATGLEHDEYGRPDYSPKNHYMMTRNRFKKLTGLSKELDMEPAEAHGPSDAKIGIIAWGSTEGAIREARYLAAAEGIEVKHLHTHMISPLPEKQISKFLVGLKYVIVAEENYTGQFAHFIKAKFGIKPIEVHKCEGIPFTPAEILNALRRVAEISDGYNITRQTAGH